MRVTFQSFISVQLGFSVLLALMQIGAGAVESTPPDPAYYRRYTLTADWVLQLTPPHNERFDASGLLRTQKGDLLTVNDRGPTLYRIELKGATNEAKLTPLPDCFTTKQLAPISRQKRGYYDTEGIAQDTQGRLYISEESARWILRWDPALKAVERLAIDWTPAARYFSRDSNASFEGVAVGGNRLYVANERQRGCIIVVELDSLKVIDHFVAYPFGKPAQDVHYSDLCWFDGALYALLRESSLVLKIDPVSHQALAEYRFRELEEAPGRAYQKIVPTSVMEGLSVDRDYIWLLTDNNGLGRVSRPDDKRPSLFRCPLPKD